MKKWGIVLISLLAFSGYTDTVQNYMQISANIPAMELKPNPKAQAWARSARDILLSTDETIVETVLAMNRLASEKGTPFFCLPENVELNPKAMDLLIQETYKARMKASNKVQAMPVSEVAVFGLLERYPCVLQPGVSKQTAMGAGS